MCIVMKFQKDWNKSKNVKVERGRDRHSHLYINNTQNEQYQLL